MNLAIDLGNTFAKAGVFADNTLVELKQRLSIEMLLAYVQELHPNQIIISSVNQTEQDLIVQLGAYTQKIIILTSNTPLPIVNLYDTPQTLGADRLAAALGAATLFPTKSCLVIDMGTCITYDFIDDTLQFHGGIISPGVNMRFKAMNTFTKRLPLITDCNIPPLIGKHTHNAMQSGVMNGLLAEIEGIISQYQQIFSDFQVVMCGGDAPLFESRLKTPIFASPELVLIGLNNILTYNLAPPFFIS
jgi:type III pantothenate kinase